jgi:hypothetical protein
LAVAGAGLGGLAAAALLARQNKRTVLVDPADTAGGALASVRKEGFVFSTGPNLSFGFERGGPLQALCSDLGISPSATVLSPCYQVLLPGRRVSVFRETWETIEELRREFPREIDAIARFYRDLRKMAERAAKSRVSSFLTRHRSAGTFLRSHRFSRDLTAFFDIPSLCFFQQPAEELPLFLLITLFDTAPLSVRGGFIRLTEQLVSVILKNGGEIRHGEPRADVSRRNGQASGLSLSSGSILESAAVLVNAPSSTSGTTVFLGVREEVIPLGMSQEVLCLPDPAHPEMLFTLSVSAPDHEAAAPRGMRAVAAAFPFLPKGAAPVDTLVKVVAGVIPFLDRFLVTVEEHAPVQAAERLPSQGAHKPLRDALGVSLLSRTSVKNLYVLPDDSRSPLRTACAARRLAEQLT